MRAAQVLERLEGLPEYSHAHAEEWRNDVARDLNAIIGYATFAIDPDGGKLDSEFGAAVLRVVERVAEFERIEFAAGVVNRET